MSTNACTETPKSKFTPDQLAAHDFLSELRTRIAVQPLPYQSGVEARALESLWKLFDLARRAMKDNPGCAIFAHDVTQMLNMTLRPVTAKWHRAHAEGQLNSRDGTDAFRGDFAKIQAELWEFAKKLHEMAYGTPLKDTESPAPMSHKDMAECMELVSFGIARDRGIPAERVDDINNAEGWEVFRRRAYYGIKTPVGQDAIGVGLSGGGIRSATFCLGAIQVLADRDLLKGVDFLSTVSGGGYTGSFLSSRLGNNEPHTDVAAPFGPDSHPVRHLRHHAKYLTASDLKEAWSMVTATLAGMLLNWTAPLFAISALALLASYLPAPPWPIVTAAMAILSGVMLLPYGVLMRVGGHAASISGWLLGILVALATASGVCWLIDVGYGVAHKITMPHWHVLAAVGAITTAAPAVMRFIPVLRKPTVQQIVLRIMLVLAGFIIPLAAVVLFYALLDLCKSDPLALIFLVALFAVISLLVLNVNLTGPHRLYRDQLAATFIQHDKNDHEPKPLSGLNPGNSAPYQLINTTVNLPSSDSDALRDRKSDFFLFSKHWCGSPSTEYQPTTKWQANGGAVDLATAMAISGAAFSSNMGLASMPTLRAMLTFLNVRLGFWIRQPEKKALWGPPGFLCLMREMTGVAMSENRAWLNLSDGGHIENMAVYELLRRRCKFIISIDGEADPDSSFHGHLTLVRHAQIDFGIRIDSILDDLRPQAVSKFSKTHYMLCRVHYPSTQAGQPPDVGLLLYVKLSTTGNEEELIKRYHLTHPDFPHQTTLDQFFDEEQFEAYRQLGVHVMNGLFSRALMNNPRPPNNPEPQDIPEPHNIPDWFYKLARNLLEPTQAR